MSGILKILSLIPIFILAVLLSKKIVLRLDRDIYEVRGENSDRELKRLRKNYHDRILNHYSDNGMFKAFIQKIDNWLIRCGNYLFLNAFSYLLIKLLVLIIFIFLFVFFPNKFIILIPAFLVAFFAVEIFYIYANATDDAEIRADLPRIYNILETEAYADIPIDRALIDTFEVIKNKRLQKSFVVLSADILTNRDIPAALNKLQSKFYSRDVYSFCLTIEQGIETGKVQKMLSNQRRLLNKTYLNNKDKKTDGNDYKVMVGMFLLFGSMAAIILYNYVVFIYSKLSFLIQ